MSKSKIEWTDRTWNPVRGCRIVSEGCRNCYAMKQAHRFSGPGRAYEGLTKKTNSGVKWNGNITLVPELLNEPLKWKKPVMVFVNSMGDLFHEDVPFEFIDQVFAVMACCPQHTFQILTKRPKRMLEWFRHKERSWANAGMQGDERIRYQAWHSFGKKIKFSDWKWPLPNVWMGVSVEDQKTANERIPLLQQIPAAVRFISAEPLLGLINLTQLIREESGSAWVDNCLTGFKAHGAGGWYSKKIDWIIVGGESGPNARPMHPDWARSIRDQCAETETPFFFKQWGEYRPNKKEYGYYFQKVGKRHSGHLLDGKKHLKFPKILIQ